MAVAVAVAVAVSRVSSCVVAVGCTDLDELLLPTTRDQENLEDGEWTLDDINRAQRNRNSMTDKVCRTIQGPM